MVKFRNITLLVCGALLAGAPAICAQKPPVNALAIGHTPAIQNLPLTSKTLSRFAFAARPVALSATVAPDLSGYRGFRFGMDVATVAKLADLQTSDAKRVYQRPALIEELEWRLPFSSGSLSQADSVREVLFSFYNGALFRMVITYDSDRIEGLTDQDMVEGISSMYGIATTPADRIIFFSAPQSYSSDGEKVIARWQDSQYSFNLYRSSYQSTFGMVALSKRLDPLAQAAILEAARLDTLEAPQREIDSQKREQEAQADIRRLNKPNFHP